MKTLILLSLLCLAGCSTTSDPRANNPGALPDTGVPTTPPPGCEDLRARGGSC